YRQTPPGNVSPRIMRSVRRLLVLRHKGQQEARWSVEGNHRDVGQRHGIHRNRGALRVRLDVAVSEDGAVENDVALQSLVRRDIFQGQYGGGVAGAVFDPFVVGHGAGQVENDRHRWISLGQAYGLERGGSRRVRWRLGFRPIENRQSVG